jgi:molecular chaperone DnaK
MAAGNKSLGKFILDGIPPAPRGVPQIEVTFDIDADGILNVSAEDKATGREQSITITASSGLGEDEIERMVHEAEQHAEDDKTLRELQEARNNADNTVYSAEKLLREHSDKLPESAKQTTQEKIEAVRGVMESDNASTIRSATEDLMQQIQSLGAQMYEQQAAGPQTEAQPGQEPGGPEDEDVVEGEVVE